MLSLPRPAEKQAAPPREKSALPRPAPRKLPNPAGRGGAKLIVDSDISAAQFHKRLNLSPDYENDDDNYDDKNNYDDADGDDDEGIHENSYTVHCLQ